MEEPNETLIQLAVVTLDSHNLTTIRQGFLAFVISKLCNFLLQMWVHSYEQVVTAGGSWTTVSTVSCLHGGLVLPSLLGNR